MHKCQAQASSGVTAGFSGWIREKDEDFSDYISYRRLLKMNVRDTVILKGQRLGRIEGIATLTREAQIGERRRFAYKV
jgi:hypothetical protein